MLRQFPWLDRLLMWLGADGGDLELKVFQVVIAQATPFDPLTERTTPARIVLYDGRRIVVQL